MLCSMLIHRFVGSPKMRLFHLNHIMIPTRCCVCHATGHHNLANLCMACQSNFPCIPHQCARCALPLAGPENRCGHCLKQPPTFDLAFSALLYQPPVSALIHRIKQGKDQTALPLLASIFCERANSFFAWPDERADAIVPIPLHWRRYLNRGYNQSLTLAQQVGRQLALPVETGVLNRIRHSKAQQGMTRAQRLRNLNSTFTANRSKATDKVFILLDDVITTGATMNAAAKALKAAGATSVIAWSLARTPFS